MIRITFNSTDARLVERIKAKIPEATAALERALNILMLKLQRKIVSEKLSGQVLAQRSGKLAASINVEGVERRGEQLIGRVTGAAGPAWYGRVQEKGGTRAYVIAPVNKKALAFFPQGSLGAGGGFAQLSKAEVGGLYKRGSLRPSKFGKFSQYGGVVVKSVNHPPLPARPFMRPALEEMREEIVSRLQEALTNAVTR